MKEDEESEEQFVGPGKTEGKERHEVLRISVWVCFAEDGKKGALSNVNRHVLWCCGMDSRRGMV